MDMNGIEAESVEVIFLEPVKSIVNEEVAHDTTVRAIEVDRISPGCLMALGKELRRVLVEVIAFRTEVVVDNIEKDHQPFFVRGLNHALQIFGPSVAAVGCVRQNAVVAPISGTGKIGHRHQLNRCDSQVTEIIELLFESTERAFRRECAYVQFVDDSFFPRAATPF